MFIFSDHSLFFIVSNAAGMMIFLIITKIRYIHPYQS